MMYGFALILNKGYVRGLQRMAFDVKFYTPTGRYDFLSNFYYSPFQLNGKLYVSAEHYYRTMQVQYGGYAPVYELDANGHYVFVRDSRDLPFYEVWESMRDATMLDGLMAKFTQHPDLKIRLLNTVGIDLVEFSPDQYWSIGKRNRGKNRLGQLLMEVRDFFLTEKFS